MICAFPALCAMLFRRFSEIADQGLGLAQLNVRLKHLNNPVRCYSLPLRFLRDVYDHHQECDMLMTERIVNLDQSEPKSCLDRAIELYL